MCSKLRQHLHGLRRISLEALPLKFSWWKAWSCSSIHACQCLLLRRILHATACLSIRRHVLLQTAQTGATYDVSAQCTSSSTHKRTEKWKQHSCKMQQNHLQTIILQPKECWSGCRFPRPRAVQVDANQHTRQMRLQPDLPIVNAGFADSRLCLPLSHTPDSTDIS